MESEISALGGMGSRPSGDSTVRQLENVMTVCDTPSHAQTHHIEWKAFGGLNRTF